MKYPNVVYLIKIKGLKVGQSIFFNFGAIHTTTPEVTYHFGPVYPEMRCFSCSCLADLSQAFNIFFHHQVTYSPPRLIWRNGIVFNPTSIGILLKNPEQGSL